MTKQFTPLFLAGLMAVAIIPAASAASVDLGNVIVGGGFTNDSQFNAWSKTGAVNRRAGTDTINTSGGNAGFNSFFTSAFATLGDDSDAIGGDPSSGTSTLSQTFALLDTIPEFTVESYDLRIRFRTVFDGRDDGSNNAGADIFKATLSAVDLLSQGELFPEIVLFSQRSNDLPDGDPSTGTTDSQLQRDPFNRLYTGLLPGIYTLTFSLNESNSAAGGSAGFTNTAAGVDGVSVNATAVPEPSTLALVGAALVGLALRRRNA